MISKEQIKVRLNANTGLVNILNSRLDDKGYSCISAEEIQNLEDDVKKYKQFFEEGDERIREFQAKRIDITEEHVRSMRDIRN